MAKKKRKRNARGGFKRMQRKAGKTAAKPLVSRAFIATYRSPHGAGCGIETNNA